MIPQPEREQIVALINREVVPAIGCTEPIAVALCVAKATEILGTEPERIVARLSANILKNAMGVGIPGTGMIGLPIAIALGALIGKSAYRLEVLRDVDAEAVARGKRYVDEKRITIGLKEGIEEKLYIEIEAAAGDHTAVAVIAGGHTNFVFEARDGQSQLDQRGASAGEEEQNGPGPVAAQGLRLRHDDPARRAAFHPRNPTAEQSGGRAVVQRGLRALLGQDPPPRQGVESAGRQRIPQNALLHLRGLRRPHGRGP